MSVTLFLSTHFCDALYGAGALLASLPPSETYHASVYGPRGAEGATAADLAAASEHERLSLESLGIQAIGTSLVASPNAVDDQTLQTKLSALLATINPDTVILPLGLAHRDGDLQLIAVCLRLRQLFSNKRWLQYYDQPFIGFNRGRYPELAFARRVRMLAEVDDEASMFNWKPVGAPAPNSPLQRKIEACLRLGDRELAAKFFVAQDHDFPADPGQVREHITRVLGQREWLSTVE